MYQEIPLQNLVVSSLNVRKHGTDVAIDTLASTIEAQGLLNPLTVRPLNGRKKGKFEVIAGARRLAALQRLAARGVAVDPVPCMVKAVDDLHAGEVSLTENLERLPMDIWDQYDAFYTLAEGGMTAADIALRFGVTERLIQQRLALGALSAPIKAAARASEIDPRTAQALTLASEKQQKQWWKLYQTEQAPYGDAVKRWLTQGDAIATTVALFPLAEYSGALLSDLFEEQRYFDDTKRFWKCQRQAVTKLQDDYLKQGWAGVEVIEPNRYWQGWDYQATNKAEGGRVYLVLKWNGEVEIKEGFKPRTQQKSTEAKSGHSGEVAVKTQPELSQRAQDYVNAHKRAAVQEALLARPDVALRLAVAFCVHATATWTVQPEKSHTAKEILESAHAQGAGRYAGARATRIETLLGKEDEHASGEVARWAVFQTLCAMDDGDVLKLLAVFVADALETGTGLLEAVGEHLQVDLRGAWKADDLFFEVVRNKAALCAMLAQVVGPTVAAEYGKEPTAKLKSALRGYLAKAATPAAAAWIPDYLHWPHGAYTSRGGIRARALYEKLQAKAAP